MLTCCPDLIADIVLRFCYAQSSPIAHSQPKEAQLVPIHDLIVVFPFANCTDCTQRDRTRSPRGDRGRRSRSPRRSRRSYSRSRSPSREDYHRGERRDRSPMSGAGGASGGHAGSTYGGRGGPPSGRSFEDRSVAREHMMQSVRDSSQQDRRVYVGNLSYDVKWHHLKDFMRQGECHHLLDVLSISRSLLIIFHEPAGEVLFADVLLLPNGMSKVGANA